jgi:hypothetical protein
MSELPQDDLAPVPMRVRHVVAGDVFVSQRDGSRWDVTSADGVLWCVAGCEITAEHAGRTVTSELDPDHVLDVLIPVVERDAVELLHAELGARLTGRRSTDHGTA